MPKILIMLLLAKNDYMGTAKRETTKLKNNRSAGKDWIPEISPNMEQSNWRGRFTV